MDLLGDSGDQTDLDLNRQIDQLSDLFERQSEAGKPALFGPFLDCIGPEGRSPLLSELVGIAYERMQSEGIKDPAGVLKALNPELDAEISDLLGGMNGIGVTEDYLPPAFPAQSPRLTPRRRTSRNLRLRCPHCSNAIELLGDTAQDSVDCTLCHKTFSLVDRTTETRMAEALQRFGRFELISRLGFGGCGTVWKARDTELERAVALKIPRHDQLSDDEMELFAREARAVAQLRHPNIVLVHEVGREEDAVFIVSDLIRGVSLADLLTGKRPTPKESAALCAILCDALEHAHRKGIIHRDLKPSNVMIDDEGTPFLMDFGLAKREADEVTMTTKGQIIGTPAYMSPEQARGDSAWADRRTDVYSLGVILFELLTGELPFRGNSQMQVTSRLVDDAPNVRTLNPHLARDLATICAKCLERAPGKRYQTAKELQEELNRYLAGIPIKARAITPIERGVRWVARNPLPATIGGLVLLLAIGGPAAAVVINGQRAALQRKYTENANLILEREKEGRLATARADELESRLDVWEGRANPWELWPPSPSESPKRQQAASLLAARGEQLSKPVADGSEAGLDRVRRLMALANLREATGRATEAVPALTEAAEKLSLLLDADPRSESLNQALGECYDRLSTLVTPQDRKAGVAWLEKSVNMRRRYAERRPADPLAQALWMESEQRAGAAGGFDGAAEQLKVAEELNGRLARLWPTSTAELYVLACQLGGRTAWLMAKANPSSPTPTTATSTAQ